MTPPMRTPRQVRPVLISGGAGFIGTNLAHRLLGDGIHAVAVEREVSLDRERVLVRILVAPDGVFGAAISYRERPVGRIAAERAIGAMRGCAQQVHAHVGARKIVHRRERALEHDLGARAVGDRDAPVCGRR